MGIQAHAGGVVGKRRLVPDLPLGIWLVWGESCFLFASVSSFISLFISSLSFPSHLSHSLPPSLLSLHLKFSL